MRMFAGLLLGLAALSLQPAWAASATTNLSECLKDHSTGKDRKELVRWIFVAMSAHPDMRSLTNASDTTRQEASKSAAQLFTRLLTENCAVQTRAAVEQGGAQGMAEAFRSLGEVAMMELMSNTEVSSAISAYTQFLNKEKFEAALGK